MQIGELIIYFFLWSTYISSSSSSSFDTTTLCVFSPYQPSLSKLFCP
jgi:hypothetical protein